VRRQPTSRGRRFAGSRFRLRSQQAGRQLAAARHAGRNGNHYRASANRLRPGDRGVLEMFDQLPTRGSMSVPGREERRVSLIHVADLVALLLLAAEKGERLQTQRNARSRHLFHRGPGRPHVCLNSDRLMAIALGRDSCNCSAPARAVNAADRTLRRRTGARAATSRLGKQRQDNRSPGRVVDVLIRQGPGAVGLVPRSHVGRFACAKRPNGIARPDGYEFAPSRKDGMILNIGDKKTKLLLWLAKTPLLFYPHYKYHFPLPSVMMIENTNLC